VKRQTRKSSPPKPQERKTSLEWKDWTHVDPKGRARMVNVSSKRVTQREAWATGSVTLKAETLKKIEDNSIEKGDVLSVAKVSAIMAAKQTSTLIPMCHPLQITGVEIFFSLVKDPPRIDILAKVLARDRTGVEMEALTAIAAASLTIYDMCKAIDRGIRITDIGLLKKSGGKSGVYLSKEFLRERSL
jgi:cyclic pyranopterin monophosphate synthase